MDERQAILFDDAALDTELLRMTDSYTDELFPATPVEADRVIFPLSRLVCDVERFPSDEDEPKTARGMGVAYVRTSFGDVLRASLGRGRCAVCGCTGPTIGIWQGSPRLVSDDRSQQAPLYGRANRPKNAGLRGGPGRGWKNHSSRC
jgi:N-formylglutamate amidohydrolase